VNNIKCTFHILPLMAERFSIQPVIDKRKLHQRDILRKDIDRRKVLKKKSFGEEKY